MAGDTHYDVLGVTPSSDSAVVRKAYLVLARQFHPDFYAEATPAVRAHAEAKMRGINAAWEVLGSPSSRNKYDKHLVSSGQLSTSGPAATRSASGSDAPFAHEQTSGSAPPRLLTLIPALCLGISLACFAVGMVTGLAVVLAIAVGFALLGAVMFIVVPFVALRRSKRGRAPHGASTVNA